MRASSLQLKETAMFFETLMIPILPRMTTLLANSKASR